MRRETNSRINFFNRNRSEIIAHVLMQH